MAKIESNIPLPPRGNAPEGSLSADIRALAAAKIGDSILVEAKRFSPGTLGRLIISIVGAGCMSLRKQSDGSYRVWKIAEPVASRATRLVPSRGRQ